MVKGLYTAYSGLTVQQKRLDVVSNNLANATTTGYKKEGLTTQSFKDVYGIKVKDETVGYINQNIGTLNLGAKIGESFRSWDQGSFQNTGNTFDFALSGSGLFSISFTNKAGETSTLYTRDGSFQMNREGRTRFQCIESFLCLIRNEAAVLISQNRRRTCGISAQNQPTRQRFFSFPVGGRHIYYT